ncbi:hypothetical protein ACFL2K_02705 [Candidatus Margulisiibacteriota bacterium]
MMYRSEEIMSLKEAKKIEIIYDKISDNHFLTAQALQESIQNAYPKWEVKLTDILEVIPTLDVFASFFGTSAPDFFNDHAKNNRNFLYKIFHSFFRYNSNLKYKKAENIFIKHFLNSKPGIVMSLIPLANKSIYNSLQNTSLSKIAFVTLMTDFADFATENYIFNQKQYYVCSTVKAVEQIQILAPRQKKSFCTSGLVISPHYYKGLEINREKQRKDLGLAPNRTTGLISSEIGSKRLLDIARNLKKARPINQFIFVCGQDEGLIEKINKLESPHKIIAIKYGPDVKKYMLISDYMITRPCPYQMSVALKMKLPLIVEKNKRFLANEKENAAWIEAEKLGIIISDLKNLQVAVKKMNEKNTYNEMKKRINKINNQAVFEMPKVIEEIIKEELHSAKIIDIENYANQYN